jgi:ribosome-associated protein
LLGQDPVSTPPPISPQALHCLTSPTVVHRLGLTGSLPGVLESAMITMEFKLRAEYVALCDLLKLTGIADSGGQGKRMIANGEVTVDGLPESRKTAKIRAKQTVQCQGQTVRVVAAEA